MAESMPIINPENQDLGRFLRGKGVRSPQPQLPPDADMHELLKPYIVPEDEADDDMDDTGVPAEAPAIGNTSDVAYQIRQINQAGEEIAAFRQQALEAAEFYAARINALEERSEFLKENIGRWLKMNGMRKLATHSGTIYFARRTKVTLPDDETLVRFASAEDPEHAFNLTLERPNKAELKKYITSTGHAPEGYFEESTEQIAIRKVA